MVKKLVIAGHGKNKNGSFDPGASGFITKGEHKYYVENFFPAVRKYLPDNHDVILFSDYNVYDRQNVAVLAKSYGKDTQVIEMHFDATSSESASGGHVIVHRNFTPDVMDLNLRDMIKKHVGVRYEHKGHKGISGRSDLRNCNLSHDFDVNYRLIELGFGTNRKDSKVMTTLVDTIAKDFVMVLCGKVKEVAKPTSPNQDKFVHVVKAGDTLWDIAVAEGLTLSQLRTLNPGIKDTIFPGQEIKLGTPKLYTVKQDDTLSGIGARLGIKWQTLATKNDIKAPYIIHPGQRLRY